MRFNSLQFVVLFPFVVALNESGALSLALDAAARPLLPLLHGMAGRTHVALRDFGRCRPSMQVSRFWYLNCGSMA